MAKSIMIQGTASNAGKSLIVAGLCRIFKQDGYLVAPFKSQNMALNSFITKEGMEMSRAQVVQAEAAGIAPHVDMNPILLKPTCDTKSQLVIQGEVFGDMNAQHYYSYKQTVVPKIKESFGRLASTYDIIVIEGAGSPAEINLKENDVVNMFMAKHAAAPVLLVGDIDRGGVFASLVGTYHLFDDEERHYLKGVLINKFRGDVGLLKPGLEMLETLIHRPVLGVIPYARIDIEDEDSLTERFQAKGYGSQVDIAVIRLPHISNFTDFNALSALPGVAIHYVTQAALLGTPDMIIIPGTKNTMDDLAWMRNNGLEEAVKGAANSGRIVWGICGGYQMLGTQLSDPDSVETGGEMKGMGLMPLVTIFEKTKVRTRVSGSFGTIGGALSPLSGMNLEGYEVHMGVTAPDAKVKPYDYIHHGFSTITNRHDNETISDGAQYDNVYGTYVHGIFDADEVAPTIIRALCAAKGTVYDAGDTDIATSFGSYKESQYDLWADTLRVALDMQRVYEILEKGA